MNYEQQSLSSKMEKFLATTGVQPPSVDIYDFIKAHGKFLFSPDKYWENKTMRDFCFEMRCKAKDGTITENDEEKCRELKEILRKYIKDEKTDFAEDEKKMKNLTAEERADYFRSLKKRMLEIESFMRAFEDLENLKNRKNRAESEKKRTKGENIDAKKKERVDDEKRWLAFLKNVK